MEPSNAPAERVDREKKCAHSQKHLVSRAQPCVKELISVNSVFDVFRLEESISGFLVWRITRSLSREEAVGRQGGHYPVTM